MSGSNTGTTEVAFLSRKKHLAEYDRLPRALRQVLADAPHNYDPRDARRFWTIARARKWTPAKAAVALREIIAKHVNSLGAQP